MEMVTVSMDSPLEVYDAIPDQGDAIQKTCTGIKALGRKRSESCGT
jgi:hypothetical protein